MVTRALETQGREYGKAEKELRFSVLALKLWQASQWTGRRMLPGR